MESLSVVREKSRGNCTPGEETQGAMTILRAGKGREPGTFRPLHLRFSCLGWPFAVDCQTYEFAGNRIVIPGEDENGRAIELKPGMTLIDGVLDLPSLEDESEVFHFHFLGKVKESVEIPGLNDHERPGYILEISQLDFDDEKEMMDWLKLQDF